MSNDATPIIDRNTPAGRAVVTIVMHCGNPICALTINGKAVAQGPCTPVAFKAPVRSPSTGAMYTHQVFALAITADEVAAINTALVAAKAPRSARFDAELRFAAASVAYDSAVAAQRWGDISRLGEAREAARLALVGAQVSQ
jgi:hypothetical protein